MKIETEISQPGLICIKVFIAIRNPCQKVGSGSSILNPRRFQTQILEVTFFFFHYNRVYKRFLIRQVGVGPPPKSQKYFCDGPKCLVLGGFRGKIPWGWAKIASEFSLDRYFGRKKVIMFKKISFNFSIHFHSNYYLSFGNIFRN